MTGNDAAELNDDVFTRTISDDFARKQREKLKKQLEERVTCRVVDPDVEYQKEQYAKSLLKMEIERRAKQEAKEQRRQDLIAKLRTRADKRPYVTLDNEPVPAVNLTYGQVRPDWHEYFFEVARVVSTRATCPRASIGVVLVDGSRRIVGTGYNGAPPEFPHCTDVGCIIYAGHCVRAIHAEINALTSSPRGALDPDGNFHPWTEDDNVTAYVYGPREICSHCARSLHTAGVKETVCRTN